jgi:hypothetical protein
VKEGHLEQGKCSEMENRYELEQTHAKSTKKGSFSLSLSLSFLVGPKEKLTKSTVSSFKDKVGRNRLLFSQTKRVEKV